MCVSTMCGLFLGQRGLVEWPCDPSISPTRDASDRLLPSHVSTYEYPRLVGSRCVERLRARATGKTIAWFTSERFASVGRTSLFLVHRDGRFTSRRDACRPYL
jgi:hypothetical protein